MRAGFPSHLLMWLLPLTASNTLVPFYNFTNVTTKHQHALTTKGASSQKLLFEDNHITPASTVTANPIEKDIGSKSSRQTTQTNPFHSSFESKTSTVTDTYTTHTNNSSTGVQTTAMRTTAMTTTQDCNRTKLTEASTMQSNSTHSTGDGSTNGFIHTPPTSPNPEEITSGNRSLFTGEGVAAELTSPYRYLANTPVVDITKTKQPSQNGNKPHQKRNHSKAIAGIICGTLALMVAGLVVIYIKKQKLQKKQLTTTDWAGSSPFLYSGAYNGQIALQSSNGISLARFLPQRLSIIPEAHEDLVNMNLSSTFGQVVDRDRLQETNKTVHNVAEIKPSVQSVNAGKNVTSSASLQKKQSVGDPNEQIFNPENHPQ